MDLLAEYCYNCFRIVWTPLAYIASIIFSAETYPLIVVVTIIVLETYAYVKIWHWLYRAGWQVKRNTEYELVMTLSRRWQIGKGLAKVVMAIMHLGFYLTLYNHCQTADPNNNNLIAGLLFFISVGTMLISYGRTESAVERIAKAKNISPNATPQDFIW